MVQMNFKWFLSRLFSSFLKQQQYWILISVEVIAPKQNTENKNAFLQYIRCVKLPEGVGVIGGEELQSGDNKVLFYYCKHD